MPDDGDCRQFPLTTYAGLVISAEELTDQSRQKAVHGHGHGLLICGFLTAEAKKRPETAAQFVNDALDSRKYNVTLVFYRNYD